MFSGKDNEIVCFITIVSFSCLSRPPACVLRSGESVTRTGQLLGLFICVRPSCVSNVSSVPIVQHYHGEGQVKYHAFV